MAKGTWTANYKPEDVVAYGGDSYLITGSNMNTENDIRDYVHEVVRFQLDYLGYKYGNVPATRSTEDDIDYSCGWSSSQHMHRELDWSDRARTGEQKYRVAYLSWELGAGPNLYLPLVDGLREKGLYAVVTGERITKGDEGHKNDRVWREAGIDGYYKAQLFIVPDLSSMVL